MAVGRFLCVALPLILTIGSIVAMLIATLSGVAHNRLYLFQLDVEDLSIDPADVGNIADNVIGIDLDNRARQVQTENITAKDLQLGKSYDINLWGYCYTDFNDNDRHCTDSKLDWASDSLNTTYIEEFGSAAGVRIDLPDELTDALKAFKKVSKWTQVATIIALVALGIELVLGILSNFSRIVSCVTWLVACVTIVLVGAAAGLATAQSVIVVGAVEGTAKFYGARGKIGGNYLAAVWISFVFALAAGLFWLFTICCCKPESRRSKHRSMDGEKLLSSGPSYARVGNDHEMSSGLYNNNPTPPSYGAPRYPAGNGRSDLAYEPYSHRV